MILHLHPVRLTAVLLAIASIAVPTSLSAIDCNQSSSVESFQKPGQIGAQVYFQTLHALAATDGSIGSSNDRDEVYIRVVGRTRRGEFDNRLPLTNHPDDYYEFWDGTQANAGHPDTWTNQDQFLPYFPEIWQGLLDPGEKAELLVVVMEQDNENAGEAKKILTGIFGACADGAGASKNPYAQLVAGICKGAGGLSNLIPDNDAHDLIGAFMTIVENNAGELQTTYLAADGKAFGSDVKAATQMITAGGDPFLSVLENQLAGNAVRFETSREGQRGRYELTVVARPLCPADVSAFRHRLAGDDVERGNCDDGQPLDVRLSDGRRLSMRPGDAVYALGDGDRDIQYWCNGSWEHETDLFAQVYPRFAIQRTDDQVNFYPYTLEPYIRPGGIGTGSFALTVGAPMQTPSLSRAAGRLKATWAPGDVIQAQMQTVPMQIVTPSGERCERYADQAVALAQRARAMGCGLSGPRWSEDRSLHQSWCVRQQAATIDGEARAREDELGRCERRLKGSEATAAAPAPLQMAEGELTVAGAEGKDCDLYAITAVAQERQNRERGCRFVGPGWNPDVRSHHTWCERQPADVLAAETKTRSVDLERCLAGRETAVGSDDHCTTYAATGVLQAQLNERQGCGYSGPRWSTDFLLHYHWCEGQPPAAPDGENAERQRLLAQCGVPVVR